MKDAGEGLGGKKEPEEVRRQVGRRSAPPRMGDWPTPFPSQTLPPISRPTLREESFPP